MKILMINHLYLDKDLCKTSQLSTIDGLNKLGNDVRMIVPSNNLVKKRDKTIIKLYIPSKNSFISSPLFNLYLIFFLPIYLLLNRIDIILVDYTSSLGTIPLLLLSKIKLIRTKFIFFVRSPPVESAGVSGKIRNLQYFLTIKLDKFYSGLTFLTEKMQEEESLKYNLKNENVQIWGTGVDEKLFDSSKYYKEAEEIRKEYKIKDSFIVFYHGVVSSNRGIRETIEAVKKIKNKIPNILFFVLGAGPSKEEFVRLVKKQDLTKNVIIKEPVDHAKVPGYISIADVGIVPLPIHKDWNSQSSLKLLEYLSMEKPVIITDIYAHRKIVGNNNCGFYTKNNSSDELAKSILKVFSNREKLNELGKTGRKIILKNYTWRKVSKELERFMLKLSKNTTKNDPHNHKR